MSRTDELTRRLCLTWEPEDPKKDPWLRAKSPRGLCLRVRPRRSGAWSREFFYYFCWASKAKYRRIGEVGTWSLPEAEEEARRLQKMVDRAKLHGEPNPLHQPVTPPAPPKSLSDLAEEYQQLTDKSGRMKREDEGRWRNHVLGFHTSRGVRLGSLPACDVTPKDLWDLRGAMAGKPVAFNRVAAMLSHAFNLARQWGYIPENRLPLWSNPTSDVPRYAERATDRGFDGEELRAIFGTIDPMIDEALRSWRSTGNKAPMRRARLLLALRVLGRNGMRPGELRRFEKRMVFWDRSFVDLPEVKGDRKIIRGRLVACGWRTLEDLRRMSDLTDGSTYFLPNHVISKGPASRFCFRKIWAKVLAATDESFGLRLSEDSEASPYAFRHSVINSHSEAGVDFADVGDFAGHSKGRGSVTHRYRHSDAPRLVRVAQQLEDYLESVITAPR